MAETTSNSMAAVLGVFVNVVFWLALIVGALGFALVGTGLIGSFNDGAVKLPGMETYVENVQRGQLLVALVGIVIFAVGVAFVCAQLSRILKTLAEGDPFVPQNAPRLTRIAIAIGLVEALRMAATLLIAAHIDLGESYTVRMGINLAVWGAVIVLLVLSQVFREGTRLREEEKMTI